MKRLLVTGANGLLGLNLAYQAVGRFHVTGVLRGERALAAPGRTPFDTILADLSQPGQVERVLEESRPDFVVHCAALTDVDRCERNPEAAYRLNTELPGWLASATAGSSVRLLHISTDAIFDGVRGGYTEEDVPNPVNVYARTKLQGEQAVVEADPDALIARVNFYGWSWVGYRSLSEFFFHALSAGKPVTGFSDLFFCPLLVNDLIEILLKMLERDLKGVFHVVSSESLSKYAFACLLARSFGFDESLVSPASYHNASNLEAARSPLLTLSSEKLERVLGEPLPGQAPAMQRYVDLYRQGYPQTLHSLFIEPDHSLAG